MIYYNGDQQSCLHTFTMPYQEKPPQWVWKVWQEVLQKSCLQWCQRTLSWSTYVPDIPPPVDTYELGSPLTPPDDPSMSLTEMVASLPPHYRQLLGAFVLPADEGAALARDLQAGSLTHYSDGTVAEGCAVHAYTLRPADDDEAHAITGGGPTCGDPDTVSSLRPEHNGAIAGSIWIWLIEIKHNITIGNSRSGIDNTAVITQLNTGQDSDGSDIHALATDFDLWQEHLQVLSNMTTSMTFFHVKGHQDDMYSKEGKAGPMTRDAYWNIAMDRLAASYRLNQPLPLQTVFRAVGAAVIHNDQVLTTKVGMKIRNLRHSAHLRHYIQEKELWEDEVFE